MSRKLEQLDTSKARKQLREISRELIEGFGNKKSVLANAFGIKGMGKDHLLALLADKLDSRSPGKSGINVLPFLCLCFLQKKF